MWDMPVCWSSGAAALHEGTGHARLDRHSQGSIEVRGVSFVDDERLSRREDAAGILSPHHCPAR